MPNEKFSPVKDIQTPIQKLEKYSGIVDWNYLKPHFKKGSMIYIDPTLDLTAVGLTFIEDNQDQVKAWLKSGNLVEPCELHAKYWEESKIQFKAMIVRPFVLAQPITKSLKL